MRGIIALLLIVGLAVFGCTGGTTDGNPPGNTTNQTNQSPIETCEGPVCGSDGATYATDCQAELIGVSIQYAGECIAPPEPNCTDSDGGIEPSVFGTAAKGNETDDDYCLDAGQLVEYSCLDNNMQMATVQCGANKTCEGGRCAEIAAPPDNQTPPPPGCSGMVAADIYRKDSVSFNGSLFTDSCVEYKVVKDYYCSGERLMDINNQCPAGYACTDGACFKLLPTCIETDDGNDTAKRGKTTVYKGMITTFDEYDDCVDEGTLKEYSCLSDGTYAVSEVRCGSGLKCLGGRCTHSSCDETDGGVDIFKFGITTAEGIDHEDECINDHDILEYSCYGDSVDSSVLSCGKDYICISTNDRCVEGSVD